jgi:hypothetical protein
MSTESSEQMMELLKELALLKKLDEKESEAASDVDIAELESRENRRREITEQIKALGEAAS